jgi:trimeric autotransporter adhesin
MIFANETGGEPLFAETQTVAIHRTGTYKVNLGATRTNGLPTDLFSTGEARWLEVQIEGQAAQPRVLLTSVPYAMKSADAATLGGLPASAFMLAGSNAAADQAAAANAVGNASSVTATGTAGYVSKFSNATTLIDSSIFVSGSDIGIGTTTPKATLDVNGTALTTGLLTANGGATIAGLTLPACCIATASAGFDSSLLTFSASVYNSSTKAVVNPTFEWEAVESGNDTSAPTATLALLSTTTTAAATPTGFSFNANGTINFAPGQTFPSSSSSSITGVTAGTGLTGGGTTGNVTLSINSAQVALLGSANSFTGNQTVTGNLTASGTASAATVNATSGYELGGTTFATGSIATASAFLGFSGNTANTGDYNTGIGVNALIYNTTGDGNTASGTNALLYNTTGDQNTANGMYALYENTTGSSNTASGAEALATNSTGWYNVAIGGAALAYNTSGGNNTASGFDALAYSTTGSNNTASGFDALDNNLTGNNNTALGYTAGPDGNSTALSNSTALGANATVSQNNTLVLGQTTVGSPGNTYVNVGIGTATPRSALEAAVSASHLLGPVFTLTNSGQGGSGAATAIDFNSYAPYTTGTYNPAARIEAVDDDFGNDLVFLSNVQGGANNGLQTNMVISADGQIGVGGNTEPTLLETQFGSIANINGYSGVFGAGAYGPGLQTGGDGGNFYGGPSESAAAGDGIFAMVGSGITDADTSGYAGFFYGDVYVNGTLSASTKDFKIDHPLDPANKYLVHASVESSEQMNIYTGNAVTDEFGLATVKLPDWFEAENTDFRYQLTVVGRKAQAWIAEEVSNGQFKISSDATYTKVSWQITAVRQDAYAKAHPLVVEQVKPARERGFYTHPELYGQPEEKQTEWGRRPEQMQRAKEMRERQMLQAQQHAAPTLSHDQPASAVGKQFAVPPAVNHPLPHLPLPSVKPAKAKQTGASNH